MKCLSSGLNGCWSWLTANYDAERQIKMDKCMFCGATSDNGGGIVHAPWCSHSLGTTNGNNYILRGVYYD